VTGDRHRIVYRDGCQLHFAVGADVAETAAFGLNPDLGTIRLLTWLGDDGRRHTIPRDRVVRLEPLEATSGPSPWPPPRPRLPPPA
jgi:hypothetical protein